MSPKHSPNSIYHSGMSNSQMLSDEEGSALGGRLPVQEERATLVEEVPFGCFPEMDHTVRPQD